MHYYNEWDAPTAAWLRELIRQGHLPAGDVDERSITEVHPDEIKNYTQWHFFAGIGGWPLALRLAGWPEDRQVLTGSPPCQPFSTAGKQRGVTDERHLAPAWLALVAALRPACVFGEQVAAAVRKDDWLDELLDALEAEGYTTGAIVLPACGVGSPHLRQRLWIAGRLADAKINDGWRERRPGAEGRARSAQRTGTASGSESGGMADTKDKRCESVSDKRPAELFAEASPTPELEQRSSKLRAGLCGSGHASTPATHSGWDSPDWLFCRDGKWRPVEPGTFPLAHGVPARVGRLRGYGNAIVPQVAVEVIRELM